MKIFSFILTASVFAMVSGCATYPELGGKSLYEIIQTLPNPDVPPATTLAAKKQAAERFIEQKTALVYAKLSDLGTPVLTEVDLKQKKLVTRYSYSTCYTGHFPIKTRVDESGNVEIYVTVNTSKIQGCGDFTVVINPENQGMKSYGLVNTSSPTGPFKRKLISVIPS